MERKVVNKWWWIWDYDREERWLNQMAANGWKLVKAGFVRFEFESCEPGEYIIRLELNEETSEYLELLDEMEAEHVGQCFNWHYYARKAELGKFELNGDIDSKLNHISRITRLCQVVCFMNLVIGLTGVSYRSVSWVNLLLAALAAYGWGRLDGNRYDLEVEREIHE